MDIETMENVPDFYILGLPIETSIGVMYPTLMENYPALMRFMPIIQLDKNDIVGSLINMAKENVEFQPLVDYIHSVTLFEFVITFTDDGYKGSFLHDIYIQYKKLFEFCFKEDVFDNIKTDEELESYVKLIKEVNDIQYEKPNPNPDIARFDRLKRMMQEAKGESISFEAMYSSVLLSSGIHPNKMTIYQFNKAFDRIGHFKNYDTTTLFKTVDASGKQKIEPWYGTSKKEKPSVITQEQLDKARELQSKGGLQSEL